MNVPHSTIALFYLDVPSRRCFPINHPLELIPYPLSIPRLARVAFPMEGNVIAVKVAAPNVNRVVVLLAVKPTHGERRWGENDIKGSSRRCRDRCRSRCCRLILRSRRSPWGLCSSRGGSLGPMRPPHRTGRIRLFARLQCCSLSAQTGVSEEGTRTKWKKTFMIP